MHTSCFVQGCNRVATEVHKGFFCTTVFPWFYMKANRGPFSVGFQTYSNRNKMVECKWDCVCMDVFSTERIPLGPVKPAWQYTGAVKLHAQGSAVCSSPKYKSFCALFVYQPYMCRQAWSKLSQKLWTFSVILRAAILAPRNSAMPLIIPLH